MPVYAQLAADFETPLSAYVKISGHGEAFLFESAESSGESGRYSILGNNPRAVIKAEGLEITHWQKGEHDNKRTWTAEKDVLAELEQIMAQYIQHMTTIQDNEPVCDRPTTMTAAIQDKNAATTRFPITTASGQT